jgi:phosphatidylglycerophosphatase A
MKRSCYVQCATLGPVGNLKAPGTVATVLTLPLAFYISLAGLSLYLHAALLVFVCILALWIVSVASAHFPGDHDPRAIVLDEVVGCLVTFYGLAFNHCTLIGGFLLFRLFDIYKPFGIAWVERCAGSWGIVLDDVLAGVLANVCVRIMLLYV